MAVLPITEVGFGLLIGFYRRVREPCDRSRQAGEVGSRAKASPARVPAKNEILCRPRIVTLGLSQNRQAQGSGAANAYGLGRMRDADARRNASRPSGLVTGESTNVGAAGRFPRGRLPVSPAAADDAQTGYPLITYLRVSVASAGA